MHSDEACLLTRKTRGGKVTLVLAVPRILENANDANCIGYPYPAKLNLTK